MGGSRGATEPVDNLGVTVDKCLAIHNHPAPELLSVRHRRVPFRFRPVP